MVIVFVLVIVVGLVNVDLVVVGGCMLCFGEMVLMEWFVEVYGGKGGN